MRSRRAPHVAARLLERHSGQSGGPLPVAWPSAAEDESEPRRGTRKGALTPREREALGCSQVGRSGGREWVATCATRGAAHVLIAVAGPALAVKPDAVVAP